MEFKRASAFLEAVVAEDGSINNFDSHALKGLKLVEASRGRCVCSLTAVQQCLNRYGTLHGGCIATLVDTVSTVALVTESDQSGVSVNLSVTYLKAVPGGSTVTVDAQVVRTGKSLATIQVDVLAGGSLCARGIHTKYLQVPYDGVQLPGTNASAAAPRSKL